MRAKVYTRYSTDKQRETSIDDQLRQAKARIAAESWTFAGEFSDPRISGMTPVANRAGGAALMADALAGGFEVLVLEGLDRLARDSVEQERIVRRLEHNGIRIIGVADGYDSQSKARKIHRGMRGMINEIYLDDLRDKVHRGLTGQVLRGLSAGGMPYGYRPIARELGQDLEIAPDEAEWVRWIYQRFIDRWSPNKIACELNRLNVPSTRGGTWAQTALYGHPKYRTGILRNPIYMGDYTWNRSQWLKDPDTGKRRRFERPQSEWIVENRPQLRIVPPELWRAAQQRFRPHAIQTGRPALTPLAGVLTCGICGGPIIAVSTIYYGCGRHKDRGPTVCEGVRVRRAVLEERIIDIARQEWSSREALELLRTEAAIAIAADAETAKRNVGPARKRLAQLEHEIANLVQAAAGGSWSSALSERLRATERERDTLTADLALLAIPAENVGTIVPRLVDRYRDIVKALPQTMKRAPAEAREALRQCLGGVRLIKKGDAIFAEVSALGVILTMVAGDRFSSSNHPYIRYREYRIA